METRIVHGSRWKPALMCLSLVFVLPLLDPELRSRPAVWISAGFFGLCALVGFARAVWPAALTLTAEGLAYDGRIGKRWSVRWVDIDELLLWRNPAPRANQTLVGWRLKPHARQHGLIANASRFLGTDGALPGLWSMSPKALLALMETYRETAIGSSPSV